ncbi:MAG: hypothetical protein P1V13_26425 [Rhizobiaceae bacterium]|nr:hypothetical protein [Rhizobiaceae bacterium]
MTEKPKQPSVGSLDHPISAKHVPADLQVYRLVPSAAADDPRWDNAPNHGEVTVRARSLADARVAAAEAEVDFLDIDAKPGDGTSTDFASAFRDDKLYHAVLESADGGNGPRGIISNKPKPAER